MAAVTLRCLATWFGGGCGKDGELSLVKALAISNKQTLDKFLYNLSVADMRLYSSPLALFKEAELKDIFLKDDALDFTVPNHILSLAVHSLRKIGCLPQQGKTNAIVADPKATLKLKHYSMPRTVFLDSLLPHVLRKFFGYQIFARKTNEVESFRSHPGHQSPLPGFMIHFFLPLCMPKFVVDDFFDLQGGRACVKDSMRCSLYASRSRFF
jgi:hypothetical protein